MACITFRRGRHVVDYRDHLGIRRPKAFKSEQAAKAFLATVLNQGQKERTDLDPEITVREYSKHWLSTAIIKESTRDSYQGNLDRYILERFGGQKVRNLNRGTIKVLLAEKINEGYARDTVRLILATLRVMLNAAWHDDHIITANPVAGLARTLKMAKRDEKDAGKKKIKAFNRDQLGVFLATAEEHEPELYPMWLTQARTGIRIGEALVIREQDFDLKTRTATVEQALSKRKVSTTKSGRERTVDLSAQLVVVLREYFMRRPVKSEYAFSSEAGTPLDVHNLGKRFAKIVKKAGFKKSQFTPHSLRHSFASLLLSAGVSVAYVQEQLGHASIDLTVRTYGSWLRKKAPGAVDGLDDTAEVEVSEACPRCGFVRDEEGPAPVAAEAGR